MMATYQEVYEAHADRYDELVDREDREKNVKHWIDRALCKRPRSSASLTVEFGCGTGRLTRYLAPHRGVVRAYDNAPHMIDRARLKAAFQNVTYNVADNAKLPEADACADFVIGGWTIGHLTGFHPEGFRPLVEDVLRESRRVAKPDATMVILETLGTCTKEPAPPNERLAALYGMLETEWGFQREILSTDYEFSSVEEAVRVMGFFFGEPMAERVKTLNAKVVPEWTGAWFRD